MGSRCGVDFHGTENGNFNVGGYELMKTLAPMGGQTPLPPKNGGERATPGPVLPYPAQPILRGEYMDEKWRPVKGYEGDYEVSTFGNVRSCSRTVNHRYGSRKVNGRVIRQGIYKDFYPKASLWSKGVGKTFNVHSLVARAFQDLIDGHGECVNHKNGMKQDNRIENLEFVTYSENNFHAYRTKLKKNMRRVLRDDNAVFDSLTNAANAVGAFPNHVWRVCVGKTKSCMGHTFKYLEDIRGIHAHS